MKSAWLLFSLCTTVSWGLWNFFPALAQREISVASVSVYQGIGSIIIFAPILLIGLMSGRADFKLEFAMKGFVFASIAGFLSTIGTVTYQFALKTGTVSAIGPITAMYPVITAIAGAIFLKERISPIQMLGIVLAISAVICMTQSAKTVTVTTVATTTTDTTTTATTTTTLPPTSPPPE